jgi:Right handed beta helix region
MLRWRTLRRLLAGFLIPGAILLLAPQMTLARTSTAGVAPVPSTCPTVGSRFVPVATATQLKNALANARAGDVIELADGVYVGRFVASRSGTATAPITLCGSRRAILDGGSITTGYGVALTASHWALLGFAVRNSLKGIMADGASYNVLRDLEIYDIGEEGVHFRRFSTHNVLQSSFIHDVGLYTAHNGEGVYVGSAYSNWCAYTGCGPDRSDGNQVTGNTIGPNTTAENVDLKEGTTGGLVTGNTFVGLGMTAADSWVDAKGNGYQITNNHGSNAPMDGFQTHVQLAGWGNDNTFHGNAADVQAAGYGFRIKAGSTGNVVGCDNVVTAAGEGFANVACS